MKVLLFVVFVSALCFIDSGAACVFDPQAACDRCKFDRDYVEYVGNACNCSEYYSCRKERGDIVYSKQVCSPCTCFSDETWGCTLPGPGECEKEKITEIIDIYPNGECVRTGNLPKGGPNKPTYQQTFQQVRDSTPQNLWTQYYVNTLGLHQMMPCPPGTYFDLPACQCLACDDTTLYCAGSDSNVFCFDFDLLGRDKGVYYNQAPSCLVGGITMGSGNALNLDGISCNLEVPFFKKNEFRQFTFCAWYNRQGTVSGEEGIIFNGGAPGDDCYPGSIRILSLDANTIQGAIITEDGEFTVSGSTPVSTTPYVWHHVCLRYNGSKLDLAIDGTVQSSTTATGTTKQNKCNLLVGQSWDASSVAHYFQGSLTRVCFYNTAVDPLPS